MSSWRGERAEKVKRIFEQFDANGDGGLNRDEMAALVVAVNPRVKFSDEQINAILDEVFRTYAEFIDPDHGLTLDGLIRTYDDGAGDVNRDFDALGLEQSSSSLAMTPGGAAAAAADISAVESAASSIVDEPFGKPPQQQHQHQQQRTAAWASSPNHGIIFDDTWRLVDDLEILVKRLRNKQMKKQIKGKGGKGRGGGDSSSNNVESFSEAGWSRELGPSDPSEEKVVWVQSGPDYNVFSQELGVLQARADASRSREEAFDGHMAIGRSLYEHQLYKDALVSFKRACELQPTDVRSHFRAGNTLYALGSYSEAREEFLLALEAAEASGNQWSYLLPQIHVNLGIALEGEGMLLSACEHYREAAILCPTHFRALKLLGCALFGVGEYRAAEKALKEAIFLRPDYADAHCDLGSALHAIGEDEQAIQVFQKAIDLKPRHVDALYNLGGLFMDVGRFQRATEMYVRVMALWPNHWRAQLNKAVSLLGAGEMDEAKKAFREAFKMTKRVEVYDAISHLKMLQKKKHLNGSATGEADYVIVEPSKFKRAGQKTTPRQELASALEIRAFQRVTRLNRCDVDHLRKEICESEVPLSYSGTGGPEISIRKAALEVILRKLLRSLKPETFQGAIKAINEKILSVLDASGSGRVNLRMFVAILAPVCSGAVERRKRMAFDALLWQPNTQGGTQVRRNDALAYIKLLRAVYIPSHGVSDMMELHGESDPSMVSYAEFLEMFNDPDWGFGILATLMKLEAGDKTRHGSHACSICRFPITGSRFKEVKHHFSLCNHCYSEGKVPSALKRDEYTFKEYGTEAEALKDKCICFSLHSMYSHNEP